MNNIIKKRITIKDHFEDISKEDYVKINTNVEDVNLKTSVYVNLFMTIIVINDPNFYYIVVITRRDKYSPPQPQEFQTNSEEDAENIINDIINLS